MLSIDNSLHYNKERNVMLVDLHVLATDIKKNIIICKMQINWRRMFCGCLGIVTKPFISLNASQLLVLND